MVMHICDQQEEKSVCHTNSKLLYPKEQDSFRQHNKETGDTCHKLTGCEDVFTTHLWYLSWNSDLFHVYVLNKYTEKFGIFN